MTIVIASRLIPQASPDDSVWTSEREDLLRKLWAEGLSATHIGLQINLSRSAVVGKARRLGLPYRDLRKTQGGRTDQARVARCSTSAGIIFGTFRSSLLWPDDGLIRALEIKHGQCRWMDGDPRDPASHFCARPVKIGAPYCPCHAARAYIGYGRTRNRKCRGSKAQQGKAPQKRPARANGAKTTPGMRHPSPSKP